MTNLASKLEDTNKSLIKSKVKAWDAYASSMGVLTTDQELTTKWEVSLLAREYCSKFFMKRWTREEYKAHIAGKNPLLSLDGKHWVMQHISSIAKVAAADIYGVSFREFQQDGFTINIAVIKVWNTDGQVMV